jgi:hypothetical protein
MQLAMGTPHSCRETVRSMRAVMVDNHDGASPMRRLPQVSRILRGHQQFKARAEACSPWHYEGTGSKWRYVTVTCGGPVARTSRR